jgi:endonuclease VIII
VIAVEELAPFVGRKITRVSGTAEAASPDLAGKTVRKIHCWGKHLLLQIGADTYRIHFFMFGSYRIDDRREGREPKLSLVVRGHEVNFYTCAVGKLTEEQLSRYDPRIDVLSPAFDAGLAARSLAKVPEREVCDALMDQTLFAGVGNIIKNEVLFTLKLHPEARVGSLSPAQRRALVKETRDYCFRFYEWKKRFELKRHWQVFRKPKCPSCGHAVTKRKTGTLQRVSHFCARCQAKERTGSLRRAA